MGRMECIMIDVLEMIRSGKNGFTWCDEDYKISFDFNKIIVNQNNICYYSRKGVCDDDQSLLSI